jgi:hypothetical protein
MVYLRWCWFCLEQSNQWFNLTGIDAGIILGVITTEPPVPAVG